MYTKAKAIKAMQELRVPRVFLDLFEGHPTPKNFHICFGIPEELYQCNQAEQETIIPNGYEPLWDDGNFDAIYCYVAEDKSIRKVYIEGSEKKYKTFTHFSASIIKDIWELEWDEQLDEYSKALEFPFLQEALKFIEHHHDSMSYDEAENEYYKLIDKLVSKNA